MRTKHLTHAHRFILLSLASVTALAAAETPQRVSPCDLKQNPAAFHHKLVEVTTFVTYAFENFALFDPACPDLPGIWLEYGGSIASGTMYCCGPSAERRRPTPLSVEDVPIPLTVDQPLRDFDRLLHLPPDRIVRATLIGRFFSGERRTLPSGAVEWGGYGHTGCCSLLAIQQIVSVDPQTRQDLDYRASADQPECNHRNLVPLASTGAHLAAQRAADAGSLLNPLEVARDFLAESLDVAPATITGLKATHRTAARIQYQWKPKGSRTAYLLVVSRPYWLSFYAKDPARTAWVTIAAYESSCR